MINAAPALLVVALLVVALLVVATSARAIDVPGTDGRVRVSGWLDGLAVVDTGTGPDQRPEAWLDVEVDGRPARRLRLITEVRGRIGGPFEGGSGAGVYDFRRTYQNRSPALEVRQALAEVRGRRLDLRLGIQRFAWGKLDGLAPTDVVNPRDYHDPIVRDAEERKIGVPAAALTYYPSTPRAWGLRNLRMTLLWVPWAVPSRMALIEERWFPTSTAVPSRIRVRARVEGVSVPVTIPISFRTESEPPPRSLRAGALGLRLGGTLRSVDWDLYHYSGPETGPNLGLEAIARATGSGFRAAAELVQQHDVMHMTGADVAFVVGPVAVRAELAHFVDRPTLRVATDLIRPPALRPSEIGALLPRLPARVPLSSLMPDQDVLEWGIGFDGVWRGLRPLVQVSQVVVLDSAPRLLIADPETRLTGRLSKTWLDDRLEAEIRTIWATERGAWFAQPEISVLPRDDLRLGVGYLAIGGPPDSLIGQFNENDAVLFTARWSF